MTRAGMLTLVLVATILVGRLEAAAQVAEKGPVPVLLVPGWADGSSELLGLHTRFVLDGWPASSVVMMDFADPVGSNVAHAEELAGAIERLRRRVGTRHVDVVAHSMGGLALRKYLESEGASSRVRRVVFLATPHRGSMVAHLAWGEGGSEMVPGSDFLEELNRSPALPPGMAVLNIRTKTDLQVLPSTSSTLDGVEQVDVCCPTHSGLLDDGPTFVRIRTFLTSP